MAQSKLDKIKKEFKQNMIKSFELIKIISQAGTTLPKEKIYLIYELSFLRLFLTWEWFIEETFISYMLGMKTSKGYRAKTYVKPKNKKHAYEFVREGRDYADWTSPDVVIRKASLFFEDGEPYKDALISIGEDIKNMKTIRNAIVHISQDAQEKFKSLVRIKLGYAKRGITPGEFLSTSIKNETIITHFRNKLELASDKIVQ